MFVKYLRSTFEQQHFIRQTLNPCKCLSKSSKNHRSLLTTVETLKCSTAFLYIPIYFKQQRGTLSLMPTWMYSCYEASNDNHGRHPAPSAEPHKPSSYKHQHSGSDQRPFPVWTHRSCVTETYIEHVLSTQKSSRFPLTFHIWWPVCPPAGTQSSHQ